MLVVGGVELVTAEDVRERWGDVRADRLRDWCRPTKHRPARLRPVTMGELAALSGRTLPVAFDPAAPAQDPTRPGRPANLYRWDDVVQADLDARTAGKGAARMAA
jgi:hypothetical protein